MANISVISCQRRASAVALWMKDDSRGALARGAIQEVQVPPRPVPPGPTTELGEAAYARDNGTPGCLARHSLFGRCPVAIAAVSRGVSACCRS